MIRLLMKVCMIRLNPYTAPVKNELNLVSSPSLGYCSWMISWNAYWPNINVTIEIRRKSDSVRMYRSVNNLRSDVSLRTNGPNSAGSFFERENDDEIAISRIDTMKMLTQQSKR